MADDGVPPLREWLTHPIATRSIPHHGLGYIPTDDATFDSSPHLKILSMRGERPKQLVLTQYLPPVANQGHQSSCVAWSAAYYCYSFAVAEKRHLTPDQLQDPKWEFSPAFIYNQVHAPGGGMNLGQAFKVLRDQGCATMAEMPYNQDDDATPPNAAAKARAAKFAHATTAYVFRYLQADPETIKTYLVETHHPFTTAIPIFKDFPGDSVDPSFVYKLTVDPVRANMEGGHAITIVGYDDDKHAFRMLNSWGPNWGDHGFMWIDEDFIKKYAMEGWGEAAGGPSVRSFVRGGKMQLTPHITWEAPQVKGK
jgi:C1A family cysteine protease